MRYYYLLFLYCLLSGVNVYAQTDSLRRKKDSLLNVELDKQQARIKALTAERSADSLKKLELEKQFGTAGQLQKASLLAELNSLRSKDSLRRVRQMHQVDSLRGFVKGFAVAPFRDTLFYLFTRQGSFTAQERAAAIDGRISQIAGRPNFTRNDLKIQNSEQSTDISYRDQLLMSVSDEDALWQNTGRKQLADTLTKKIGAAIAAHIDETRWQNVLRESLLALLVVFVTGFLIYGIIRLFRWLSGKQVSGLRIKNYELLTANTLQHVAHNLLRIIKWALIILLVYLALPVLFGIFPFTKDVSALLLHSLLSPIKKILQSIWAYIPNLITIIVLVIVFRYVLHFFKFLSSEIEKGQLRVPGFYPDWANPTYQIVRVLVLAFMLIVIFPYLPGSDSNVFKGVSVFMGVLFTFGSAGALGNVVAGLVLTYMRAFKIGDRVTIGEVTGDVIEKTLLVTRLRTIQNEIVSVPNSTVMNNHTVNFSSDATTNGLILHTTVTIGYDAPWRQVHQLLIDAALSTQLIESEPAPYVLQTSLDDYYVSYRINAYTKMPNQQAKIYSQLHQNIQDKFNEAGVEIMSPHYNALRDGNATTIPAENLPKDYKTPSFNIRQDDHK
jgi:small-conductance mechanosensitive channel